MKQRLAYMSIWVLVTLGFPHSQVFKDTKLTLPGGSGNEWGDFDGDGDQDFFIMSGDTLRVYSNQNGAFREIWTTRANTAAWGDFDSDGDLDLAVNGINRGPGVPIAFVYRNDGGNKWSNVGDTLTGGVVGDCAWLDFDGDGDQDLLIEGNSYYDGIAKLYRNDNGRFLEVRSGISGGENGDIEVGDFDGDGDPDVAISGRNDCCIYTSIYRNDAGTFININAPLPTVLKGRLAWGDYDKDGDLDLALSGDSATGMSNTGVPLSRIYTNFGKEGFTRTDYIASLPIITGGSLLWSDFDSDGDVDLLMTEGANGKLRVFRNDSISSYYRKLVDIGTIGEIINGTKFTLTDSDGDGDLDLLLTRSDLSRLYENKRGVFVELGGIYYTATAEFGDVDRDGDLDLLTDNNIVRNTGGLFVSEPRLFRSDSWSQACWEDYDNDGYLEVLSTDSIPRLYHNNGGAGFSLADSISIGLNRGNCTWSDINLDGRKDLLIYGEMGTTGIAKLFLNTTRGFVESSTVLQAGRDGTAAIGDYDSDGDPDLYLAGAFSTTYPYSNPGATIFRNDGGVFTRTDILLTGVHGGDAEWGDYDNDGDQDLVVCGNSAFGPVSIIYRNDGNGVFTDIHAPVPAVGRVKWGDIDNDGDLDVLASKTIWRNDGGSFTDTKAFVQRDGGVGYAVALGDVDGDGDLDCVSGGSLLRNDIQIKNSSPKIPGGLSRTLGRNAVSLSWNKATDVETPQNGLSYNLAVGASPSSFQVLQPLSLPSGRLLMPAIGNTNGQPSLYLQGLAYGKYFWKVQALDPGFGSSAFSILDSFEIGLPSPEGVHTKGGNASVRVAWQAVPKSHLTGYRVHIGGGPGTLNPRGSLISGSDTTVIITGLENDTSLYIAIQAVDAGGNESELSTPVLFRTDGTPPATPQGLVAIGKDRSVILHWNKNTESDFLQYLVYLRNLKGEFVRIDSTVLDSAEIDGLENGATYTFALKAMDTVQNTSVFSDVASTIPSFQVTAKPGIVDFGRVALGNSRDTIIYLANTSKKNLSLDPTIIGNPVFSVPSTLTSLGPNSETPMTIRFTPSPAGGDFSGSIRVPYMGSFIEIGISGSGVGSPHAQILGISPEQTEWNQSKDIHFSAAAADSDNAGIPPHVRKYIWRSSLSGDLEKDSVGFRIKSSDLPIGTHTITLRVVDNEGDTSAPATAVLTILNRKPYLHLDSLSPPHLLTFGGEDLRYHATAFDLDQFASAEHDSLRHVGLYSTIQGLIAEGKRGRVPSTNLHLGTHGLYLLAADNEGDTTRSDTLLLPVQAGRGHVILIAGTAFEDFRYQLNNISPASNYAYAQLLQRGFSPEQIHYFNRIGWQGIGADPYADSHIVDVTEITLDSLKARLFRLRPDVEKGVPLLIALIGHGSAYKTQGRFYHSDKEPPLLPDSLDAWLNTFQIPTSVNTPIVFLLDFCYAGGFARALLSPTQNRILIASSASDRQAYFAGGRSFTSVLFQEVKKGSSLGVAYEAARQWSDKAAPSEALQAHPVAYVNRDVIPNDTLLDLPPLHRLFLGGTQQFQSLGAQWDSLLVEYAGSGRIAVKAWKGGNARLDKAWFSYIPPSFNPERDGGKALPGGDLEEVSTQEGEYRGEFAIPAGESGEILVMAHGLVGEERLLPLSAKTSMTVGLRQGLMPNQFGMSQNHPNPFRFSTTFTFGLTRPGKAKLVIRNLRGEAMRTFPLQATVPGVQCVSWDGKAQDGITVPKGIYTYTLYSEEGILSRKMVHGGR